MSEWGMIFFVGVMALVGVCGLTLELTGWQPSGYAASSHDDPSPGPNSLF